VKTKKHYKMVRRNVRLVPSTEKGELASPVWTDSEFKSLLGEHGLHSDCQSD